MEGILQGSNQREETSEKDGQEGKKLTTAHSIYQLLVGEIGIPRRDFLYEIDFWEVDRIIAGYRRRDKLRNQMMAQCAYAAMFAMRDPKGKSAADMFPSLFNDEDEDDTPPLTEDEVEDLQDLMNNLNNKSTKD